MPRSRKAWLLLSSLLILFTSSVVAESRLHRSIALERKRVSLTHAFFYGSKCSYNRTPVAARFDNILTGFSPVAASPDSGPGRYPWKYNITTTVSWVGEQATAGNPVPNTQSAWDLDWVSHYGGCDDPGQRASFTPIGFTPSQSPFYVALPYNDVIEGHTRPEAGLVVPWFKKSFVRDGQTVCKGRWLEIRHGERLCYAQWEDVGPFQTDHWQYVFGSERPRPNVNRDAGLDVSPAVRDYLGMSGMDACDWRFVDFEEVPDGPWALYPENNPVAQLARLRWSVGTAMAKRISPRSRLRRLNRPPYRSISEIEIN